MLSIPEEIIIRYLQDTATEEEVRLLNEWLRKDRKNIDLYCQMEEIWSTHNHPSREVTQRDWSQLYKEINELPQTKSILPPSKKSNSSLWIQYAAAIFVGILISSAVWIGLQPTQTTEPELLVQNVVYNHNGVLTTYLPDSSIVYIHSDSKLTYPEVFKDQRHVHLEGSAYFAISKNREKPFIVSIGNVEVEVTGTEFFIHSASVDTRSITLISGGVDVSCTNKAGLKSTVKLTPGQEAGISLIDGKIEVSETDTVFYVAWKDGTYRFTDEPLEKIAAMVAKRFDLEIHIAPTLKTKRFTGRITPENDIKDVLTTIYKSYPIKYKIEGKKITILN